MGQFGNQPDFATNDVKVIVPNDTIDTTTFLGGSVIYIGDNETLGNELKVIPAGTVGPSVISGFSSPGYVGSSGTGYGDVVGENTGVIGGSGTGLDILWTSVNGQVVSINQVLDQGTGYLNGDLVTVDDGDENAVFKIVAAPGLPTAAQAVTFKGLGTGGFLPVTVDYVLTTALSCGALIAAK
tara:strand:- start:571 stop:1119 length:549 start_codon:yes stop_codon:yes gene_type:complete